MIKFIKNRLFFGLLINKRNLIMKIGKRKVEIRSRYFHLAFQRIFSDFPFSRSSRQKTALFMRTSREERKKTREGLHKCCASHRIKKKKKKTRVGLHKCCASHRIKN